MEPNLDQINEPQFPEGHVKLTFHGYQGPNPFVATATIDGVTSQCMFSPAPPKAYSKKQMRAAFEEGFDLPFGTFEKAENCDREAVIALMIASVKTAWGDHAVGGTAQAIAHNLCDSIMRLQFQYQGATGEDLYAMICAEEEDAKKAARE